MAARQSRSRPGRGVLFLRSTVFDFAIVLAVSTALLFTVSYGFESAADLRGDVLVDAGLCAGLLAVLYAGTWSRRAAPIAGAAYVAAAVAVVAGLYAASPGSPPLFAEGQLNDVDQNYAVFGMVAAVVPLVVFLLSRRTWGLAVLLLASALACGTVQFLYRDWVTDQPGAAAALVVYVGVGALFVMQGYRASVLSSRHAKRTAFFGTFVFGLAASAACMAVGVALFFGVVAGLGIQTVNVKPFQDYYQRPVIEYEGEYRELQVEDPDETTDQTDDDVDDTSEDAGGSGAEDGQGGGFGFVQTVVDVVDPENWNSIFDVVRFDVPPSLLALLLGVPVLLVVGVVAARLHWRQRRLKKLEALPYGQRAVHLYEYFMRSFGRLKLQRSATLTPLEFALASSGDLAPFVQNASRTDFLQVTLLYQRAGYGQADLSAGEYQKIVDYYRAFFGHAHKMSGHLKWALWRFWRI